MSLRTRIHPELAPPTPRAEVEQPKARAPFVATWRRESIRKAGGRFVAVAWRDVGTAA